MELRVILTINIMTFLVTQFWVLCIELRPRFVMGLTHPTYFDTIYLLALEYVNVSKRSIIGNVSMAVGLTLGGCIVPWILRALGDWKLLMPILFAQGAIIIITPWFVHESARWLISKGKVDKAVRVMRKIAKTNRRDVSDEVFQSFEIIANAQYHKAQEEGSNKNMTSLFRTPRLRRHVILAIVMSIMAGFLFDGHVRNISNIEYSIYADYTIGAALELPACLLSIPAIDHVGRRWSSVLSLFLSGVAMLVCAFSIDSTAAVVVISMMGRFFVTISSNTVLQYRSEIMPTELRAQGVALSKCLSQFAKMFSSYVVLSGISNHAIPFFILGAGGMVSGVLSVFLPETADEKLPLTVEEAEHFGIDQSLLTIPFLCRRKKMAGYCNNGYSDSPAIVTLTAITKLDC